MPPAHETLRKYKDLPVPKLCKTTSDGIKYWFQIYEEVMGTRDSNILKYCLPYYFSDQLASDGEVLHAYHTKYYESFISFMKSHR